MVYSPDQIVNVWIIVFWDLESFVSLVCPFWTFCPPVDFKLYSNFVAAALRACSGRPSGLDWWETPKPRLAFFWGLESLRNQGNVLTCGTRGMFHTFTYVVSVFVWRSTTWFRWGKTWNNWLTAPNSGVPLFYPTELMIPIDVHIFCRWLEQFPSIHGCKGQQTEHVRDSQ